MLVGTTPPQLDVDQLRRTARKLGVDVLIGVQGIAARARHRPRRAAGDAADDEPRAAVPRDREAARAGLRAGLPRARPRGARARRRAPERARPRSPASPSRARGATPRARSQADDLLPERALAGDPLASTTLVNRIYRPAAGALDRSAHHAVELPRQRPVARGDGPRAVRAPEHRALPPQARLATSSAGTPPAPREALILQTALILGSIGDRLDPPRLPTLRRRRRVILYGAHKGSARFL